MKNAAFVAPAAQASLVANPGRSTASGSVGGKSHVLRSQRQHHRLISAYYLEDTDLRSAPDQRLRFLIRRQCRFNRPRLAGSAH